MRRFVLALAFSWAALLPAQGAENPFLGTSGSVFPNPVSYAPGAQKFGMVEGDFDEDGRVDLIAVHNAGISVLLNNGDCTFDLLSTAFSATGPGAAADFDEDGHLDLAVANTGNGLSILLGNGDGTFGAPATFTAPGVSNQGLAFGIVTGDFNENNNIDIVLGHYFSEPLAFFEGNGNGTFADGVAFGAGDTRNIAAGDIDDNGDLDIVSGSPTPLVRLGGGNGTFADAGAFPMGSTPFDVKLFDLDGDTHLDFVSANLHSDDVSVRLGNGDGTFGPVATYPVGEEPAFLAIADMTRDGEADILVGLVKQKYLALLPGTGTGAFGAMIQIPTVRSNGPVVVADFDLDGLDDVAVAGHNEAELAVFRGLDNGPVTGMDSRFVRSEGADGVLAAAFGDMDQDGLQDVVLLRDDGGLPGIDEITVRLAGGDGSFSVSATAAAGDQPNDVAIADLDNDTFPDVVVTNFLNDNLMVYPGNGDGTIAAPSNVPTRDPLSVVAGLFNADTDVDLAVLAVGFGPQVRILLGNGDGTFTFSGASTVGTNPIELETGDFNGDGAVDLVVLNGDDSDLSVLLGMGDGTFGAEVRYGPLVFSVQSILQVVDYDADGNQDLVVAEPLETVLYGAGDGTFGAPATFPDGADALAVGDVNGDGREDVFHVDSPSRLRLRQPDLTLGDVQLNSFDRGVVALRMTDTNGDTRNDVVMATFNGVNAMINIESRPFGFGSDKATLTWPEIDGAVSYNVYRGLISNLDDGDSDGLPDAGYGACQNGLDPNLTDTVFTDASIPPAGDGFFYLIAVEDGLGERDLGRTGGAGLPRSPTTPCP